MKRLKLYQKMIIALATTASLFGSAYFGLKLHSESMQTGTSHSTPLSLVNNIRDFKNVQKYKMHFKDPVSNTKVGSFDYEQNTVNQKPFREWFYDYQTKTRTTPYLIVEAGATEFHNYYLQAIWPRTFVDFVRWFAKDIPWGPDLASLSYYKISKGVKKSSDSAVALGTYSDRNGVRRIEFSPDSFFGTTNLNKLLMQFSVEPITKAQIPTLIKNINKANQQLKTKYGKQFWSDHAVRLYSLQKTGDKYLPIVSNVGNLIDKLETYLPSRLEKLSDVDVVWNKTTMQTKVVMRSSYRLNFNKKIGNIELWQALAGAKWKGLSFDWLKHVTHHEFGHLQLNGQIVSTANNFVGLKVAGANGSNVENGQGYNFDELNRYLQARVPQIRALRVAVELRPNEDNVWDWNFYQDRLQEWKDGKLKQKPDPRDFSQIAFEYKTTKTDGWTRETAAAIFGNKVDGSNVDKAPYKVDPDEFLETIRAGKHPRFFVYSFSDARKFAQTTGIPVYGLFLMNAFDALAATKNPSITAAKKIYLARSRENKRVNLSLAEKDRVSYGKFLDVNNNFVGFHKSVLDLKAWNDEPVLLIANTRETMDRSTLSIPYLRFLKNPWSGEIRVFYSDRRYIINPLARDRVGQPLEKSRAAVEKLIKRLLEGAELKLIEGGEKLLVQSANIGVIDDISFNLIAKPQEIDIANWKKPPDGYGLPSWRYLETSNFNPQLLKTYGDTSTLTRFDVYARSSPRRGLHWVQPIEYIEIEDEGKTYKFNDLVNWRNLKHPIRFSQLVSGARTPINRPKSFNIHVSIYYDKKKDPSQPWRFVYELNKKKFYIFIDTKSLVKFNFKKPVLKSIMVRMKPKGLELTAIKPVANSKSRFGYQQLQKWLKSVNDFGFMNQINQNSGQYNHEFSEVLTRDWVQITQSLGDDFKHNYPSSLFKISHKHTGIDTLFDPTTILNQVYSKVTKKTYRQIIDPLHRDPETKLRNIDYTREFVKTFIQNASESRDGRDKMLLKVFLKANEKKLLASRANNLSFLNIDTLDNNQYNPTGSANLKLVGASYRPLDIWSQIQTSSSLFFVDRWSRASLAVNKAKESTAESWLFYDDQRKPIPYHGSLRNLNGDKIQTRPEAYWTFFLQARGIGLRNISGMWLHPRRAAVTMWGFLPVRYKKTVKYLQFKNRATGELIRQRLRFDVDNLFYYDQEQGMGHRRTLADEGFASWNIDYMTMGTWANSRVPNGTYQVSFVDNMGNEIDITWRGQKLAMTGNGFMQSRAGKKTTDHIVSLNGKAKTFAPVYIAQNRLGEDLLYVKNQFPI